MKPVNLKENSDFEISAIKLCAEYLFANGGADITLGRHNVPDSDIFANVFEYETKPFEDGTWEAHKEYADLQIVLFGHEKILVSDISNMKSGEYHSDDDYQECEGKPEHEIEMGESLGLLLMPRDAHMPGVSLGKNPSNIKKCVFKIPVKYFE